MSHHIVWFIDWYRRFFFTAWYLPNCLDPWMMPVGIIVLIIIAAILSLSFVSFMTHVGIRRTGANRSGSAECIAVAFVPCTAFFTHTHPAVWRRGSCGHDVSVDIFSHYDSAIGRSANVLLGLEYLPNSHNSGVGYCRQVAEILVWNIPLRSRLCIGLGSWNRFRSGCEAACCAVSVEWRLVKASPRPCKPVFLWFLSFSWTSDQLSTYLSFLFAEANCHLVWDVTFPLLQSYQKNSGKHHIMNRTLDAAYRLLQRCACPRDVCVTRVNGHRFWQRLYFSLKKLRLHTSYYNTVHQNHLWLKGLHKITVTVTATNGRPKSQSHSFQCSASKCQQLWVRLFRSFF